MNIVKPIKLLVKKIARFFLPESWLFELRSQGLKRYFSNSGWNLIGKVLASAVAFLVNIYIVRSLGPDKYGLVSYVISYVGLFSFLAGLGIEAILYVDLIKEPEKKKELMGSAFVLKIMGACLTIVLVLITFLFNHNDFYTNFLIFIVSLSFIFQSFGIINTFFQAKVFSKPVVITSLVVSLVLSALKIFCVYLKFDLIYFVAIFFLESVFYAIGYVIIFVGNKLGQFSWKFSGQTCKDLLAHSWPLIFSSAFAGIFSRIDQVMIKHLLDNAAVGFYDVAVRLSELWYFFPTIIVGSIFPAVLNAVAVSHERYEERLSRLYGLAFYLSLIFVVPMALFSKIIIQIAYGQNYLSAAAVLSIYVWAGIAVAISTVLNQALIGEKKTKISFLINLLGMTINIVLNFIFIPRFGINGAAFATLISYSLIPFCALLFKSTRRQGVLILRGMFFK
ncbi:MAG: flippase [Patescibacteria group bacterium]|nr:flippase [Patescibacteria group bacterium]